MSHVWHSPLMGSRLFLAHGTTQSGSGMQRQAQQSLSLSRDIPVVSHLWHSPQMGSRLFLAPLTTQSGSGMQTQKDQSLFMYMYITIHSYLSHYITNESTLSQ